MNKLPDFITEFAESNPLGMLVPMRVWNRKLFGKRALISFVARESSDVISAIDRNPMVEAVALLTKCCPTENGSPVSLVHLLFRIGKSQKFSYEVGINLGEARVLEDMNLLASQSIIEIILVGDGVHSITHVQIPSFHAALAETIRLVTQSDTERWNAEQFMSALARLHAGTNGAEDLWRVVERYGNYIEI